MKKRYTRIISVLSVLLIGAIATIVCLSMASNTAPQQAAVVANDNTFVHAVHQEAAAEADATTDSAE